MVRGDAGTRPAAAPATRPARPRDGMLRVCRWPHLAWLVSAALLGGCATLRSDYVRTPSSSLPAEFDTPSGRAACRRSSIVIPASPAFGCW